MPLNNTSTESARIADINGWEEIKGNPISKVGVFDYSGEQIDPKREMGLDWNKIYKVYRSAEELSKPETIESFKLIPWTDEHEMLGAGMTDAGRKGVQGVTGEEIYFEDNYLKANIKVFSEKLANLIKKGKKELSIGYRCLYAIASGIFNGEAYEIIQHTLRGNHLATVDEGRSGPDVAVLDFFKFTYDTGLKMEPEKKETKDEGLTLESLSEKLEALMKVVSEMKGAKDEEEGMDEPDMKKEESMDEPEEKEESMDEPGMPAAKTEDKDGDMEKPLDKKGMDMKYRKSMDMKFKKVQDELNSFKQNGVKELLRDLSKRDSLASRLSQVIGTFDHKEKTFTDVVEYGVKKLGLNCSKGQEHAMLEGYLAGKKQSISVNSHATDSKVNAGSQVEKAINAGR